MVQALSLPRELLHAVATTKEGRKKEEKRKKRKKEMDNMVYTYNGIFSSFKKGGILAIFNNMDEAGGHYGR